jgi:hypothetical protein
MIADGTPHRLVPADASALNAGSVGFRFGAKGTHSSRTIMLAELSALFDATTPTAKRDDYTAAIVDMNCLAKPTAASRRLTNQRIGELYSLDFGLPIFRVFRRLWNAELAGRPLLAILCAVARDPLLAATLPAILAIPVGAEFLRDETVAAVREAVGERLNESTVAKVVRNAASSWTQSGHLAGRTFKKRQKVEATATSVAFGLYLGHAVGFRGAELFTSAWIAILDCPPGQARQLAVEAKRMGLLDLRLAGDVIELNLDRLDPAKS